VTVVATKRFLVTLDEDQYEILQSIKGMGTKDAEKIRNIVVAYFSEKNYIKTTTT
jgi:ERCC4-type nuclease